MASRRAAHTHMRTFPFFLSFFHRKARSAQVLWESKVRTRRPPVPQRLTQEANAGCSSLGRHTRWRSSRLRPGRRPFTSAPPRLFSSSLFMAPTKELVEAAPDSAAFRPHWHAYSVLAAGLLAQAAFRAATSFCQWSD